MTDLHSHLLKKFDPFENRLCRNIRNDLSESLIKSIHAGNTGPSRTAAGKYASEDPEPFINDYIDIRVTCYESVLHHIQSKGIRIDETYRIAVLLWDQELFFEVHEWLEEKWHTANGVEKKVMQALIRAAGTYVHLSLGRLDSAKKIAQKALAGLVEHKASVPVDIDVERLIEKLQALDPIPPQLGSGTHFQ